MIQKTPLSGHLVRHINGSFAWISHRFIRKGFWASLTLDEYICARDDLINKDLISFDDHLFQILSLPEGVHFHPKPPPYYQRRYAAERSSYNQPDNHKIFLHKQYIISANGIDYA